MPKKTKYIIGILVVSIVLFSIFFIVKKKIPDSRMSSAFSLALEKSSEKKEMPENSTVYTNTDYKFSLAYPKELEIQIFTEEDGDTILFQHPAEKRGFQLFISSYPDKDFITDSVLRQYLPGLILDAPQEIILPGDKHALLFWSEAPEIGKTREVWFIHNDYLFGITTYAQLDEWLAYIIATIHFIE